jgi:hypothetical protein
MRRLGVIAALGALTPRQITVAFEPGDVSRGAIQHARPAHKTTRVAGARPC